MSDTLRRSVLRIASNLPTGNPTRRKLLAALKTAGWAEIQDGMTLRALKDVRVSFPVASGRGNSGVLKNGSRVKLSYATNRGDVFTELVSGEVSFITHGGQHTSPHRNTPIALSEGHKTRHPYDWGMVDGRFWAVV